MGGLDGNGESIKAERSPRGSPENSDFFGNKRKGRPCSIFAGFEPSPASTASLNKPQRSSVQAVNGSCSVVDDGVLTE